MSIYDFQTRSLSGVEVDLSKYEGKVLLIVNTASKCGLTPQYKGLQELYDAHRDQGFEVLGFPCNQFGEQEPGTEEEIHEFCSMNYGVTFPMFRKTLVNGPDADPLFRYLKEEAKFEGEDNGMGKDIQWNFTKFLIGRDGRVLKRFEPGTAPSEIEPHIRALLQE